MKSDEVMKFGVPTKIHRKVGINARSVMMCVALVSLVLCLSFVTLSNPITAPSGLHEQVPRDEPTPKELLDTCYRRRENGMHVLLPQNHLDTNGCEHRLPGALVLGAKKCGTGALRVFLDTHPNVVFSKKAEPKFFTENYSKGLDWYRDTMRQTTPSQIAIEKSPGYFYSFLAAKRIMADLPETTKFIVILCNPVRRTISDFTFQQLVDIKEKRGVDTEEAKRIAKLKYDGNEFERYVMTTSGRIRSDLDIITRSMYDKYILRWTKTFSRSRFLFVDGDSFTHDPVDVLKEIERFLDVPSYFNGSKFYFDSEKGFYCLSEPFRQCLKSTKGLEHPPVDKTVLRKLSHLYKAHDSAIRLLTWKNFTWMNDDKNKLSLQEMSDNR